MGTAGRIHTCVRVTSAQEARSRNTLPSQMQPAQGRAHCVLPLVRCVRRKGNVHTVFGSNKHRRIKSNLLTTVSYRAGEMISAESS